MPGAERKADYLAEILLLQAASGVIPEFPTVRAIAQHWHTSKDTASLARRIAAARLVAKSGAHVPGIAPENLCANSKAENRPESIALSIQAEFVAGEKAGIALPPIKQMMLQYGCSHQTLKRALALLSEKKLVIRQGRRNFATLVRSEKNEGSRVYMAGARSAVYSRNTPAVSIIRGIEQELESIGWNSLEFFLAENPQQAPGPSEQNVAGFIHLVHETKRPFYWRQFFAGRPRTPVVLIDPPERARLGSYKRFLRICPDNQGASRKLAQYLAESGHRHIAFFSHTNTMQGWSLCRLQGLKEIFAQELSDKLKISIYVSDRGITEMSRTSAHAKAASLYNEAMQSGIIPAEAVKHYTDSSFSLASLLASGKNMVPHFETALTNKDITAWVCINDELAAAAYGFLIAKGIGIGHDISLAGFDNAAFSYTLGLTSYDFSFEKIGRFAVQWLANPRIVNLHASRQTVRFPGQLIVRKTTGNAPQNHS